MKKKYLYLIIVLGAVISMLPLLIKTNIWGHDTTFHIANILDISESISLDNLFPKINFKVGNSLGYGTHLFYASLPHYIGGYLHLILQNFNFEVWDTLVFLYLIISILSGIVMFQLAYDLTKNKYLALTSSFIYLLMPYRMGDIIVRSALNEVFVFFFIPMILLSLNRLIENKKYLLLFVAGYVGLILSHLVLSLYTSIFLIIWGIINYKKLFTKENIKKLITGIILVTIIVLPNLIMLIEQKSSGNYMIFQDGYMSGLIYVETFSNTLKDFFIPLNDYSWDVPHFINILVFISFILSVIHLIRKREYSNQIFYLVLLFFIAFIMCLKNFPWKLLPDSLYMIQFAWRLEIFTSISLSVIAPIWLLNIKKDYLKYLVFISLIILVISEIPFLKSLSTYKYLLDKEVNYNLGMGHSKEYLPVNAYNNIAYFNAKSLMIENSEILEIKAHKLVFKVNKDTSSLELPRLYYNGYVLKNSKGRLIDFYENEYGFIVFEGISDTYTLEFTGPILYQITYFFRTISLIIIIIYMIKKRLRTS